MERCFQRLKQIPTVVFGAGWWEAQGRGEDFRRGKRHPRASKNRAKSSDDGRQELGKSWARSGPASSTPHPASRGRRIRQGASHQPGPAPDARSDGRASEEANSWGPFDSFRGAWVFLGRLGLSWGRLGGSWGRLGPSWGRLGGSWGRLGPSWGGLGESWGCLGAVLGGFGLSWANFWDPKSTPSNRIAILCRIQARFGPLLELVLVAFRFQNRYKNRVRFQTCQKLPPGHPKS